MVRLPNQREWGQAEDNSDRSGDKDRSAGTVKEVRLFLGSVKHLAKFIEDLSAKTESIPQLVRKETKWNWGEEQQKAFKCHNRLTTDASTKGLGATLWQIDEKGRRPVAFASRYLCRAEKS